MFAKWLEKEMNMGNTEAQLIITKSKSAEVKSGYEELTVAEMVKRGFSAHPVCISRHNYINPQPETHHYMLFLI